MYDDSALQQQALLDNDGFDSVPDDLPKWNDDRVKAELPHINIELPDGSIVEGTIFGHSDELFAKVTWYDKRLGSKGWVRPFEVCWDTIAHCLNGNRPVVF